MSKVTLGAFRLMFPLLALAGPIWIKQTVVSSCVKSGSIIFLQLTIVGYLGITEQECMDRKCCWLEKEVHKYIYMHNI